MVFSGISQIVTKHLGMFAFQNTSNPFHHKVVVFFVLPPPIPTLSNHISNICAEGKQATRIPEMQRENWTQESQGRSAQRYYDQIPIKSSWNLLPVYGDARNGKNAQQAESDIQCWAARFTFNRRNGSSSVDANA